ncbi:MAG: hypothetical protein IT576_16875 [Verrucomicrobiales bacterium]|nr:hypothetical protein [Verrucomicrobiales bacterium]
MKGSLTEKTRDGDGLAVAKNDRFQDVAPPNSTKPKIASECVAILLKYPKYRNSRMNFFSKQFSTRHLATKLHGIDPASGRLPDPPKTLKITELLSLSGCIFTS